MKKKELKVKTEKIKNETKQALETVLNSLNQGQRKKVLKIDEVKRLCERYGITE